MDPATVLATLHRLGGTLPPTYVVGCRAGRLDEGMGLSPAVAAAVPRGAGRGRRRCSRTLTDPKGPDMCLGIPGQVVELVPGYEGQLALVDVEGARRAG